MNAQPSVQCCYWNVTAQNSHSEMELVNSTHPKFKWTSGPLPQGLNYAFKVDEKRNSFYKGNPLCSKWAAQKKELSIISDFIIHIHLLLCILHLP